MPSERQDIDSAAQDQESMADYFDRTKDEKRRSLERLGHPKSAATKPDVWALNLRVRFDPPETEEDALREKDNIIEHLQRIGYDVEPMGLNRRG